MTSELRADHNRLEHLALEFNAMLDLRAPPSGIELVKFRPNFFRVLLIHLQREDALLYPRLMKSVDPFVATMAQSFRAELGGFSTLTKAWVLRWPTERALGDWSNFGRETRELSGTLTRRIENENRKLDPQLDRYAAS